ncbi:hypothetical protein FNV43_RR08999 [Rhamnella rubrinervis]|uniref:Uncharacterized protein n=1 Tax=Rhamnella rubrinervis TaxID=2594499 RepID=A0A8K0H9M2_9ROSA|nr:hypothetical protein FNV43_RR08999 [Rhamnella rubrinervis]
MATSTNSSSCQIQIQNFSHDLILSLTYNINGDNSQNHPIRCMACGKLCSDTTHSCRLARNREIFGPFITVQTVLLYINTEHQNSIGIKEPEVTKTKAGRKFSANEVGVGDDDQDAIVSKLHAYIEVHYVEVETLKAKSEAVTAQLQALEKEREQYPIQMGLRKTILLKLGYVNFPSFT